MVIFDTLSRSIPGGDENKAEDMTMTVKAADYLRDRFGAATVYVHHSGKDPEKGARGHSALFAAADLVLRVMDGAATVDKVRDGVGGERFPFTLEPIELGLDADGDPVMTCLLNPSDDGSVRSRPEPKGKNQLVVYGPLKQLITESGRPMPGTSAIPKGARAVTIQDLIQRATPKFAGQPEWRAKQRITEAVMSLQAAGYVGVHNDFIWLI
jgi:putative DNA primase/helicase